jgi:hypothetical protein
MGSCGFMLLAKMAPDASADNIDRILQGVIAGIGFIGGGAIIKKDSTSYGVVTAASIWNTGLRGGGRGGGAGPGELPGPDPPHAAGQEARELEVVLGLGH